MKQPWYKKMWLRFLWHLKELNKMFSDQKSYYSMKRFKQFVLFSNAVIILDVWVWKNIDRIDSSEALEIFGANLVYAGFILTQIQKEKRNATETQTNPTNGGDTV